MKFGSFSFGCRLNQAEREDIDQRLVLAGLTYGDDRPDFYVINTCAVTAKAEREARQLINKLKSTWPEVKLVVTGCAATKWLKEGKSLPGVTLVDNPSKERLATFILKKFSLPAGGSNGNAGNALDKYTLSGRRFIKIQEGCHRFCSYCLVPFLRGKPHSRTINEIINQINNLGSGISEVILTAVNTEDFGKENGETLSRLLEKILELTTTPRISFGSINPWSLDADLVNVYKENIHSGRLSKFFHIPLQSGSDRILRLMNRGYTLEEFREKVEALKLLHPLALIGTDILVGFPGETDSDFEETYQYLSTSPINKFHIFRFSLRENTAAVRLVKEFGDVQSTEKTRRSKALQELGKKKYHRFLNGHAGLTQPVLFLVESTGGFYKALLDNQVPVWVKTTDRLAGLIKPVKVEAIKNGQLYGKLA